MSKGVERCLAWSFVPYLLTTAMVVVAYFLRTILQLPLIESYSFITFFPAVAICSLLFGGVPGLLATVLSILLVRTSYEVGYFISPPILVFLGQCLIINYLAQRIRIGRTRAEAAAREHRETQELFENLANHLPQIVWTNPPDGSLQYLNQTWSEYTGLSLQESLADQNLVNSYIHPDDRQQLITGWEKATAEGVAYGFEYRLRGKNGGYRRFLGQVNPIRDNGGPITRWVGAATDIEDARAAEATIKEHEAKLALAFQVVKLSYWELDMHTKVVTSDLACDVIGMAKAEGIYAEDRPFMLADYFKLIHPEDKSEMEEVFTNIISGKIENFASRECRLQLKNGEVFWRAYWGQRYNDTKIFGVSLDITERKNAELELKKAKEAAEAANNAKNLFLANVSHEIRTPLNAILGFSEQLMSETLPLEKRISYMSIVKRNSDQLLELINDILDLAKVEAEQIPFARQKFDLVNLLLDFVNLNRLRAENLKIAFTYKLETKIPHYCFGEPNRITQVLTNLVNNAFKFTREGGVHLAISYLDGNIFRVTISDTGIGISEDDINKLFKPFSQVDISATRRFGGSGLGLVLSRNIARQMGGDLTLAWSEPGKGSIFVFEIPLDQSGSDMRAFLCPKKTAITRELTSDLKGVSILLAEDSIDTQVLMRLLFENAGALITIVDDGQQVLTALEQDEYDVVLMDIQMPVLDGLTTARRLRDRGYRKPLIALSAHAFIEAIERSFEAGFDRHLVKPVAFDKLQSEIIAVLK